jgi:hypothetical protein
VELEQIPNAFVLKMVQTVPPRSAIIRFEYGFIVGYSEVKLFPGGEILGYDRRR